MKKILPIFILMSSFCFSISQQAIANLMICTEAEKNNHWRSSIDFLTYLMNNEEILDVDKVHYLVELSKIYIQFQDETMYNETIVKLNKLCNNSLECMHELRTFYEYLEIFF